MAIRYPQPLKISNYSGDYGRCFTRHAVTTCSATLAALCIPCSVCSPAHTSMYGRSQLFNPLLTLLRLFGLTPVRPTEAILASVGLVKHLPYPAF